MGVLILGFVIILCVFLWIARPESEPIIRDVIVILSITVVGTSFLAVWLLTRFN